MPDPTWGWIMLAWASTLAGNLTLFGSVANIIVMESAGPRGEIGFWRFLRYGVVLTALSLAIGFGVLALERELGLFAACSATVSARLRRAGSRRRRRTRRSTGELHQAAPSWRSAATSSSRAAWALRSAGKSGRAVNHRAQPAQRRSWPTTTTWAPASSSRMPGGDAAHVRSASAGTASMTPPTTGPATTSSAVWIARSAGWSTPDPASSRSSSAAAPARARRGPRR